jgi:hypothetical protein
MGYILKILSQTPHGRKQGREGEREEGRKAGREGERENCMMGANSI